MKIIFEDRHLIVVNKAERELVHHSEYARNIKTPSLVEQLKEEFGQNFFPIHRLDYKTTGVVIFAKDKSEVAVYQDLFLNKSVTKKYLALVRGWTDDHLKINSPISPPKTEKQRMPKDKITYKPALSLLQTLKKTEVPIPLGRYESQRYSLVELTPVTGRTHQLRKHMNHIHHPIIGDHKYGDRHHNRLFEEKWELSQLFLHAHSIVFKCPFSQENIEIKAGLSEKWIKAFEILGINVNI